MTYNQYRKRLLASYYSEQLTSFISQFDPNKKTVFLLPGGMGSNLNRTEQPYPTQDPNLFDYQVWLGLETLSGGNARYIQIDRSLADGEHFVVGACGPISIFGLSPYHKFIEQGKANWNLFICGFDWRRSIEDSAKFFTRFMRDFAAIVNKEFGYKTSDITLVAHSMGGLVLTYALHELTFITLNFNGYIIVATNFYGWPPQIIKYHCGQEPFNTAWGGVDLVARTVSCLPGGYALMPMPMEIFTRYKGDIGLDKYPVRDKETDEALDPYDSPCAPRWPQWVMQNYLQPNISTLRCITDPFERAIGSRFFNVRSTLDDTTTVALLWKNAPGAGYQAGDKTRFRELKGPGDGVLPYWTTFHAGTPPANRYCMREARNHVFLLETDEVFKVVDSVVQDRRLPRTRPKRPRQAKIKVATRRRAVSAVKTAVERHRQNQKISGSILRLEIKRSILQLIMS